MFPLRHLPTQRMFALVMVVHPRPDVLGKFWHFSLTWGRGIYPKHNKTPLFGNWPQFILLLGRGPGHALMVSLHVLCPSGPGKKLTYMQGVLLIWGFSIHGCQAHIWCNYSDETRSHRCELEVTSGRPSEEARGPYRIPIGQGMSPGKLLCKPTPLPTYPPHSF